METEKCGKCGVEVEKGALIRDAIDSSQLRCNTCIAPDKKPRKPRKRKETSVIAAVQISTFTSSYPEEDIPPVDPVALRKDAEAWAEECGLGKCIARGPDREDYPRYGFGYTFQISEISGKQRKATARYTCRGERSYWSIDGMVSG